jgi:hypothetical protein
VQLQRREKNIFISLHFHHSTLIDTSLTHLKDNIIHPSHKVFLTLFFILNSHSNSINELYYRPEQKYSFIFSQTPIGLHLKYTFIK